MVAAMAEWQGPVYLRLPRVSVPPVHGPAYVFAFGKVELLAEGKDIVIFAHGDVVRLALAARSELLAQSIEARVVNVPCLKPLPPDEIIAQAEGLSGAITVEDHSVIGGLGSAVAEACSRRSVIPLIRIGIQDRFTESDDCDKLRDKYGISVLAILAAARELAAG
jgi:transketolase